ncbi:PTTG1 interacting protein b isoform X2 [Ictalurus furcatus]|uniref:PTTG1 interacting protein b isoform X2 n=1 Tax=Ictalurus furcatus TaxID=66913 RepID=UPI00235052D9|nr:PTTG1 interacting protein b isoform X2 [Ictalurus furcatus]
MGSVGVVFMFSALCMAFRWTDISAQINCIMKSNTSCAECVSNITCLWCSRTQQCLDYPVRTLLPPHSLCSLNDARWGNCWGNRYRHRSKRTNEHVEREAEIRRVRHEERKAEMRSRHDEIRKKYGLMKENPYSRFENN